MYKAWPLFSHFPRYELMTQFAAEIWSTAEKGLLASIIFFGGSISFIDVMS